MAPRFYSLGALLAVAVLGHTLEVPDASRIHQRDGLIRYPVTSTQESSVGERYKRQINTDALAQEHGNVYTIDLTIGTPGQTVPVQIDTGSSLLWVNPKCDTTQDPTFCNAQPRLTESSTQTALGKDDAQYKYVSDYVSIGSAKISQQIFGIANVSSGAEVGVLGVGPSRDGWDAGYPSVIDSLAKQGLTNSRAFSVDLKGFDNTDGSVIFGGIDTGKYEGSLTKLPIIPASQSPDKTTRFWVSLDSITINQADGTSVSAFSTSESGKAQTAALDTGNDVIALPSSISQKFAAGFPSAKYDSTAYQYTVDCNDPGQGQTVDFTFGDAVIKVPFAEFIARNPTDSSLCTLGILDQGDVNLIDLGQPFFRAAFAVFDWDNQNVHLAQSADCGSNLVPIGNGADAVPSLTGDCGKPAPTSSTSSFAVSSTSSSSATPTSTSTSSSVAPPSTSTSTSVTPTSTSSPLSANPTSSGSESSAALTSATPSSSESSASSSGSTSTATAAFNAAGSSSSASSTSQISNTAGLASKVYSNTAGSPSASSSIFSTASASSPSSSSADSTTYTYTYTTTRTSTITSCPVTVTSCPVGAVVYTTDVITATTEVCPESVILATGSASATATATAAGSTTVRQKSWTTSLAAATTAVTSAGSTTGVAPAETETETECVLEAFATTATAAAAATAMTAGTGTGTGTGAAGAGAGAVGAGNGTGGGGASAGSVAGSGNSSGAGAGAVGGAGTGPAAAGPVTTLVWSAGSGSGSGSGSGATAGTGAPYVSSSLTTPTQSVVYAGAGRVGPGWVLTAVMAIAWVVVSVGM